MVPLRDEKCYITFVHAHTPTHTHTELEDIVKGSHEHVLEVMRHKHVAVADSGVGRVEAQGMGRSTPIAARGGWGCCKLAHPVRLTMVFSHGYTSYGAFDIKTLQSKK